jgi:thiol:disulfide interchange protein
MKHRMPGTFRLALCALISLLLGSAAQAAGRAGEPDILKPEQAFRYTTSATADEVVVRWTIEPAHYLYRERMSYESRTPGITLGSAVIPAGTPHNDEYFGQMHIFRDQLEVRLPVSDRPPGAVSLTLAIKSQGCADIGLCYPPQVWLANVELPAAAAAAASSTAAPGRLGALLNRLPRSASDEPLPVAQAFPLDVAPRRRLHAADPLEHHTGLLPLPAHAQGQHRAAKACNWAHRHCRPAQRCRTKRTATRLCSTNR